MRHIWGDLPEASWKCLPPDKREKQQHPHSCLGYDYMR